MHAQPALPTALKTLPPAPRKGLATGTHREVLRHRHRKPLEQAHVARHAYGGPAPAVQHHDHLRRQRGKAQGRCDAGVGWRHKTVKHHHHLRCMWHSTVAPQ